MIEFTVSTPRREVLVDITSKVQEAVARCAKHGSGAALVFVPHTTAAVTVNEGADPSVAQDIVESLAGLAPDDRPYHHREGNADAHIKATLVGNHLLVPVEGGRLRLGTWQSVFLAEFDGPRTRRVWVTIVPATPTP